MNTRIYALCRAYFVGIAILCSVVTTSMAQIATTANAIPSATSSTVTTTTISLTTSATAAPKSIKPPKRVPSKALRIFLETRNVVARPEGYETLLTIEQDGAMTFEWHTVSGKRKSVTAQLKPKELKELLKTLDAKKFMEGQPYSTVGYADWMQSISIEKDEKEKTLRMMIDYRKRTPEAINKVIQDQLGEVLTKDIWNFIASVRVINDRFKWSGQ
jgi:hypothetical protein